VGAQGRPIGLGIGVLLPQKIETLLKNGTHCIELLTVSTRSTGGPAKHDWVAPAVRGEKASTDELIREEGAKMF
jgi:hypothetical protein